MSTPLPKVPVANRGMSLQNSLWGSSEFTGLSLRKQVKYCLPVCFLTNDTLEIIYPIGVVAFP